MKRSQKEIHKKTGQKDWNQMDFAADSSLWLGHNVRDDS